MPAVTRVGLDKHVGHASPTPSPFHKTAYASGSPDVFTNGAATVRVGDKTGCGDPATVGSGTVFVNGLAVHRQGDGTGGHGSWVPSASASGSSNVFADDGGSTTSSTVQALQTITGFGTDSTDDSTDTTPTDGNGNGVGSNDGGNTGGGNTGGGDAGDGNGDDYTPPPEGGYP